MRSKHDAIGPVFVLTLLTSVAHVLHLTLKTSAAATRITGSGANHMAVWVSTKSFTHVTTSLIVRLGLKDLDNASNEPHRCFGREVPLYGGGQPLSILFKVSV